MTFRHDQAGVTPALKGLSSRQAGCRHTAEGGVDTDGTRSPWHGVACRDLGAPLRLTHPSRELRGAQETAGAKPTGKAGSGPVLSSLETTGHKFN